MSLIDINKRMENEGGFIPPVLRQNIVTSEWIVVAPGRSRRPDDFVHPKLEAVKSKGECPFCVGSKGFKENEILSNRGDIYVIENKFPAFYDKSPSARSYYPEEGFYRERPSVGQHEVVIIKDHDLKLTKFHKALTSELFWTILERYQKIKQDDKIFQITPIYNHGPEAGASIDHPHAQIFASGVVANTVNKEMDGAERYFGINGVCVYCDIIKHERKEKQRIIFENDYFLAFAPYASRYPFETWVVPKKHQSQFETSSRNEIDEFASATSEVLQRLEKVLPGLSLNMYIRTLPTTMDNCDYYHWYLEIAPRLTTFGGFEMGSGVIINIVPPEKAAEYLKQ
ncbi:MAG: HIT domain-containing protein [Candidatus Berkelbacteria bacterium]